MKFNFLSATDVILDSSPDSSDNNILPSVSPVSEVNSKFLDTGSTVQSSSNSEIVNSSVENSSTPTVTVERPALSPIPVALVITSRPIQILNPSDEGLLPILLSPQSRTETEARKQKACKHWKPFDATFCDEPNTSALRNKIDETSVNVPDLKKDSDNNSETFSMLYPKLSSGLSSTSFMDVFLNGESKRSSNNPSNFLSQTIYLKW